MSKRPLVEYISSDESDLDDTPDMTYRNNNKQAKNNISKLESEKRKKYPKSEESCRPLKNKPLLKRLQHELLNETRTSSHPQITSKTSAPSLPKSEENLSKVNELAIGPYPASDEQLKSFSSIHSLQQNPVIAQQAPSSSSHSLKPADDIISMETTLAKLGAGRRGDDPSRIQIKKISQADLLPNQSGLLKKQKAEPDTYPNTSLTNDSRFAYFTDHQHRKHNIQWLAHRAQSKEYELEKKFLSEKGLKKTGKQKYGF